MERRGMIHRAEESGVDAKRRRERRRLEECRRRGFLFVLKYCRTYCVLFSLKILFDQCWCVYPIRTFPTIMRSAVAFPSDEDLQFLHPPVAPRVEDLFNLVFFFPFDKFWGWFVEICSMFCRCHDYVFRSDDYLFLSTHFFLYLFVYDTRATEHDTKDRM